MRDVLVERGRIANLFAAGVAAEEFKRRLAAEMRERCLDSPWKGGGEEGPRAQRLCCKGALRTYHKKGGCKIAQSGE